MSDPEEMLALNELTGLVHDYTGTGLGGHGSAENAERHGAPVGVAPCGCEDQDWLAEAVEADTLTVIKRRHLERGIWEPAECLQENDDGGFLLLGEPAEVDAVVDVAGETHALIKSDADHQTLPIVDLLDAPDGPDSVDEITRREGVEHYGVAPDPSAQEIADKLEPFVKHRDGCQVRSALGPDVCTCGMKAAVDGVRSMIGQEPL